MYRNASVQKFNGVILCFLSSDIFSWLCFKFVYIPCTNCAKLTTVQHMFRNFRTVVTGSCSAV